MNKTIKLFHKPKVYFALRSMYVILTSCLSLIVNACLGNYLYNIMRKVNYIYLCVLENNSVLE